MQPLWSNCNKSCFMVNAGGPNTIRRSSTTPSGLDGDCTLGPHVPATFDHDGFVGSWPWRHRNDDNHQRNIAGIAKLKTSAQRHRQAQTWLKRCDLFVIVLAAPHLALSRGNVPELFDRAMLDRQRCLANRQREVGHAAAAQAGQEANFRAIGCEKVEFFAK